MEKGTVELRVRGVTLEGDEPIVVLEDKETQRRLLVEVGPFEASAIIMELEGILPPRPLTHDLLAEFFEEGGFVLDAAELFGDSASGARARLAYRKGIRKFEKEVRPSDAMALALRLGSPLRAEVSLFEKRNAGMWKRPKILGLDDWKARVLRA